MARHDLREVIEQILEQIKSTNVAIRRQAYTTVLHRSRELRGRLSRSHVNQLIMSLHSERDGDTVRCGLLALSMLGLELFLDSSGAKALVGNGAVSSTDFPAMRLGDWLWQLFHRKSAVFSVVDSEPNRRDEPAETQIGRRLSHDDFPRTNFQHFFTSPLRAHIALPEGGYKAVCVIGRPGLLGPPFLDLIRCPELAVCHEALSGPAMRFGFEVHHRPKDLPRSEIDRAYHYIIERHGDGTSERHETVDDGTQRRDYGIVQCYTIDLNGIKVFVVVCAGASSLGTLGGATWSSLKLFRDEGAMIIVPPNIQPDSRMEALVRVTADSTLGAWESPRIELVKLYVDDLLWSPAERKWVDTVPEEITVVYRDGKASGVVFDRRTRCLKRDSDMFTLIVKLAERALKGTKRTSLDELHGALSEKRGHGIKKNATTSQLNQLRTRYLHEGLTIDSNSAELLCKVRRFDES